MAGLLLDTNHLSEAIRRTSKVRPRLRERMHHGVRVGTCVPVLCELEAGIVQTRRPASCRHILDDLLHEIRVWPVDRELARTFGELYFEIVRGGHVLSHVDIVLAALARTMRLTISTTDRDFEALPDIQTENWLT